MHVGIVMDGNGRWATRRGRPRSEGHRKGVDVARQIVDASLRTPIRVLTLYAFSCANWNRPQQEVAYLLSLFRRFLNAELRQCIERGVRVRVIGRRDRLGMSLGRRVDEVERKSAGGRRLLLQLAVDYSSRDAIRRAFDGRSALQRGDSFEQRLASVTGADPCAHEVDLVIRTGGEKRLSDFLLWESAYAELIFLPQYWPDFTERHLLEALRDYNNRERRYGAIPGCA